MLNILDNGIFIYYKYMFFSHPRYPVITSIIVPFGQDNSSNDTPKNVLFFCQGTGDCMIGTIQQARHWVRYMGIDSYS